MKTKDRQPADKIARQQKVIINGFRGDFGTITKEKISSYLNLVGYIQSNHPLSDFEEDIRILRIKLRRYVLKTYAEVFEVPQNQRTYVSFEFSEKTQLTARYFHLNIDLFFNETINVRDKAIQDKHQVLLELLVEWLLENREFKFYARNPMKSSSLN